MNVLVLAPHPDDETIGCGGTLRHHVNSGHRVRVAFLTSGERGVPGVDAATATRLREIEAERAAEVLGLSEVTFLRFPDTQLGGAPEVAAAIRRLVDEERPDLLYLPHAADGHPDHSVVMSIVTQALPVPPRPLMRLYEVWTPLGYVDEAVDIDATMATKLTALHCYSSQLAVVRFHDAAEGLARYRGALVGGCTYAEAFCYTILNATPASA